MTHREIFNECGLIETPDSVSIVSGSAADNTIDLVDNRFDETGAFSDEFICAWFLSVSDVLSFAHELLTKAEAEEARKWFADRGISY